MRGLMPVFREGMITEAAQIPFLIPNGEPEEDRLPQGIHGALSVFGLPIEGTKLYEFVTAFCDFCDKQGVILTKSALTGSE